MKKYLIILLCFLLFCLILNNTLEDTYNNTSNSPNNISNTSSNTSNNISNTSSNTIIKIKLPYIKYVIYDKNTNDEYELVAYSQLSLNMQQLFVNNINIINNPILYDLNKLQISINLNFNYYPPNDFIFAVKQNDLLNNNILKNKSNIVFDKENIVNYNILNGISKSPYPDYNIYINKNDEINILVITNPNEYDNNNTIFSNVIINTYDSSVYSNTISNLNIDLIQIENIYLINLTNNATNYGIKKVEL